MSFRWLAMVVIAAPLSGKDSCLDCHSALDGNLQAPAIAYAKDIHARHGFTCADCHGGDREADDPEKAMSRRRGFSGAISRLAVPALCARCHSDAALMHRFKPQQRVDQLAQYRTSVHGKRLQAGDEAVANCVDCHGVHNIREVKDALSPVHPLRLPATCGRCHGDSRRMSKYKIPASQLEEYKSSVHWEAMTKRGDLSAPSCASCHGNHGATPPHVSSVAAVCGTCHVVFEELYRNSPHAPAFTAMGAGSCTVCHGNHAIRPPSDKMLAGTESTCSGCHEPGSSGASAAALMAASLGRLKTEIDRSEGILLKARTAGMEVSEAQIRQTEARENLVKARVSVHAFDPAAVRRPVEEGLTITRETWQAGEAALKERDFRRLGLGLSLITILITMAGLWMAIRTIEGRPAAVRRSTGS